jgi:hypothetical protein
VITIILDESQVRVTVGATQRLNDLDVDAKRFSDV